MNNNEIQKLDFSLFEFYKKHSIIPCFLYHLFWIYIFNSIDKGLNHSHTCYDLSNTINTFIKYETYFLIYSLIIIRMTFYKKNYRILVYIRLLLSFLFSIYSVSLLLKGFFQNNHLCSFNTLLYLLYEVFEITYIIIF